MSYKKLVFMQSFCFTFSTLSCLLKCDILAAFMYLENAFVYLEKSFMYLKNGQTIYIVQTLVIISYLFTQSYTFICNSSNDVYSVNNYNASETQEGIQKIVFNIVHLFSLLGSTTRTYIFVTIFPASYSLNWSNSLFCGIIKTFIFCCSYFTKTFLFRLIFSQVSIFYLHCSII